jgi:hypothetical protein
VVSSEADILIKQKCQQIDFVSPSDCSVVNLQ